MLDRDIRFADLERASAQRDPQLAQLVNLYVNQPDPPEDRPDGQDPGRDL